MNQDPAVIPGQRIVGSDLQFPCTTPPSDVPYTVLLMPCDMTDPAQQWTATPVPGGASGEVTFTTTVDGQSVTMANSGCNTTPGTPVYALTSPQACGASASQWTVAGDGTIHSGVGSGLCLDAYAIAGIPGPTIDTWSCSGNAMQVWTHLPDNRIRLNTYQPDPSFTMCLTARPAATTCTNVWSRPLADGSHAFAFINNDNARNLTVTCDEGCFAAMGLNATSAPKGLAIRDLWAHAVVANITSPFSFAAGVQAAGGSNIYRAIPQQ